MQLRTFRNITRIAAVALAAVWIVGGIVSTASADEKAKTERTAGKFVKWDKEAGTVLVKEKGKDVLFNVVAEGSVLVRTTVTVKAKPAKLDDLKEGQIVVVYWKPVASDPNKKDARKIDAVSLPEGQEAEEGEY
ncbi:MAG TPA: hypothetical protein DEP35_10390 [Deltaproteobacteria bacterium]|jgi:hypothetical protein|nr:hypothetical protein [Deltaproteobacteria bacterium]